MQLYGSVLSPYVRKTFLFLEEKGVNYESLANITPHAKDETFKRISPLGKIPALTDGDIGLCDSSVICGYIDKAYADVTLYPHNAANYAKALWLEEYCDTVFMQSSGGLMFERFIGFVLKPGHEPNADNIAKYEANVPKVLRYLESQMDSNDCFIGSQISAADVFIASHLHTLDLLPLEYDKAAFPKIATFHAAWQERESWKKLDNVARKNLAFITQK